MVTVIIPTYKRAHNLERAINSVLNQTYKDFEIIIVDDNDPDTQYRKDMIKLMQKYKNNEKVKYLMHEKNKNGAVARNTGIKAAKGEYITFLDDDDYYLPERLEILLILLKENKQYAGAYTSTVLVRRGKIINGTIALKSGNLKKELLLDKFSFGTGSNMFFRADALKEINGFDERFLRHQDIECMIRFLRKNKIIGINKVLVVKCQDDCTNVPNIYKLEKIKELYIKTFEKDVYEFSKEEQNQFYICNIQSLIGIAIRGKNYDEVKRLKNKKKKYGKYKNFRKDNLKNLIKLINNYIPIEKLKETIKRVKLRKNIDKEVKEVIRKNS